MMGVTTEEATVEKKKKDSSLRYASLRMTKGAALHSE